MAVPVRANFVEAPCTSLSPRRASLTVKRDLVIQVDEERVTDEEDATPFSVNRLISCPNLGPSIERSETPQIQMTAFLNVAEVSFCENTYNPALVNWAEHAPITPRSPSVL